MTAGCSRRVDYVVSCVLLVALLMPASQAVSAVDVARISSEFLAVDTDAGLAGNYVGYRVTNSGPVSYTDLWVTLDNFAGGVVAPAPFAPTAYEVGPLAPGESRPVYFYLAAGDPASEQTHDVRVHEGSPADPPLSVQTFSFSVIETMATLTSYIALITITGTPEVGSTFVMEVLGDTGTLGSPGIIILTPAGLPDWPADVFELVAVTTEIRSSDDGCRSLQSAVADSLVIERPSGSDLCLLTVYTFRPTAAKPDPTPLSPVQLITSGAQLRHSSLDNLCVDPDPCEIPPVESPTSVLNNSPPGAGITLQQNTPNPFNPATVIRFTLDDDARVSLVIYNESGRPVRSLVDDRVAAGTHAVDWSGRDDAGHVVASGIYLYRLTDGHRSVTRKMLLLK